jgi:hypothetical protein
MPEGVSYEEWQLSRIKEEVKSFMKQLINEVRETPNANANANSNLNVISLRQRNDDYKLVAKANKAAFVELKHAFRTGTESEDEVTFEDDEDSNDEKEEGTRIGGASSVIEKKEDYSVSRIIAGASNHILHAPSKSSRTPLLADTETEAAASTTSLPASEYATLGDSAAQQKTKTKAKAKKTKEKGKGKEEATKSVVGMESSGEMSSQYCVLQQSAEEAPQGKKKKKEKEKVERSKSLIGDTYAVVPQPQQPTNTNTTTTNNNRATVKDSTGYESFTTGGTNEPLPVDNYQEI